MKKTLFVLAAALSWPGAAFGLTPEKIFEQASDSVVVIRVEAPGEKTILGSGFVYGAAGEVVTCQHLVKDLSAKVTVYRLKSGGAITFREEATVLYSDAATDLAILSVPARSSLAALSIGASEKVKEGQKVFAIGNPSGLTMTFTQGIVSGIRTDKGITKIQTDTAINPGNSGGPLLDENGKVIGVVTDKFAQGEGLGFAVAAHHIAKIRTSAYRVRTAPVKDKEPGGEAGEEPPEDEEPGAEPGTVAPGEGETPVEGEGAEPPLPASAAGRLKTIERIDEVYLKDGKVLKGNVIAEGPDTVVLLAPETYEETSIPRDSIDRIERQVLPESEKPLDSDALRIVSREGNLYVDGLATGAEAPAEGSESPGPGAGEGPPASPKDGEKPAGPKAPREKPAGPKDGGKKGGKEKPPAAEGRGREAKNPEGGSSEKKPETKPKAAVQGGPYQVSAPEGYGGRGTWGNKYVITVPAGTPEAQFQEIAREASYRGRIEKVELGGLHYAATELTLVVQSPEASHTYKWVKGGGISLMSKGN